MKNILSLVLLLAIFASTSWGMGFPLGTSSLEKFEIRRTVKRPEPMLAFMHEYLLTGIKQTLTFAIVNLPTLKENYNATMLEFDTLADKYEKIVGIGLPGNEGLSLEFAALQVAKFKTQKAASKIFKQPHDKVNLSEFKKSVDELNQLFNKYLELTFSLSPPWENNFTAASLHLAMMSSDVLEAVNLGIFYTLLPGEVERKAFYQKMADFDSLAKEFARIGYLSAKEEKKLSKMFEELISLKGWLAQSLMKIQASFDASGKILPDDLRIFEKDLQTFNLTYNRLLEELIRKSL
ncbi:MAG: hypothetical protein ABIH69_06385 [bacterium]